MTHKSDIPVGQDFNLPTTSGSGQVENLSHESGWAKLVVARGQLADQVESACRLLCRGDLDEAERQFRRLHQISLTNHDAALAEVACHNLAVASRQSRHWPAAESWQQQSLAWQLRQEKNSPDQSDDELARFACDLTGRGCDAFAKQEWDLAESLWRRALAIEEWRGSWTGQAIDCGNLGLHSAARGDLRSGIRWLRKSLRLHRLMFDDCGSGTDLLNLAELFRLLGFVRRSWRCARQAVACLERAEATGLLVLARARLIEAARIVAVRQFNSEMN